MKITARGQITIPADIRSKAGLRPHTEVDVSVSGGTVVIQRKKAIRRRSRQAADPGEQLIAALRGSGTGDMTTDEIMALTRGE